MWIKTRHLVNPIDNGARYILARSRRFGKSLTVSTFEAMFSGCGELFEGLHAEEFMNRPDYRTSPVVRLDMRDYYDGFCFDGVHRLYNLFSTLCFFKAKEFNDYRMESGTPALITKCLKNRNLTVEQFRRFPVSKDFLRMPEDVSAELAETLERMRRKNYLAPWPGAMGPAMVIDDEKRQITANETILFDEHTMQCMK